MIDGNKLGAAGFDRLGTVEAVLAERPGAAKFFTAGKAEE